MKRFSLFLLIFVTKSLSEIQKCCPYNYQIINGTCNSVQNDTQFFEEVRKWNFDINLFTIYNNCAEGKVSFTLDLKNENLIFINETKLFVEEDFVVEERDFCLEFNPDWDGLVAWVCAYEDEDNIGIAVIFLGTLISTPFLLATLIIYALLPDRNLHMKALMSYVVNLLISYTLLQLINLSFVINYSQFVCLLLGHLFLFFFVASFFWMNVICIDIWLTFSSLRGIHSNKEEKKRFFLYCVYAWGISIVHIFVVFLLNIYTSKKAWYYPGIGDLKCFLQRGYSELLYLYGPIGILITSNIILFAATAFKIRQIKQDTLILRNNDSRRHTYENDKQKFNLYLKLLFVMGVNWSMEIISWAVIWRIEQAPAYIWYLPDFCNATYGVFIFFIFAFKKSIWLMLKKRFVST